MKRKFETFTLEELQLKMTNIIHEWLNVDNLKFLNSKPAIKPVNPFNKKSHKYNKEDGFKITFFAQEMVPLENQSPERYEFNIQNYLDEDDSETYGHIILEVKEKLDNFTYWLKKQHEEKERAMYSDDYDDEDSDYVDYDTLLHNLGLKESDDGDWEPDDSPHYIYDDTFDDDYGIEEYELKETKEVCINENKGEFMVINKWIPDFYKSDCYFKHHKLIYKSNKESLEDVFGD
ncbi:hypothetical protein AF332_12050 [Sporosarcina globispora]|uniref:Uncharacterized protein n=1 Tax=Sporosarcina globispora TaxID=1459 RepID=A0A0M0GCM7_SPOGL|nr:hypothetical protein [Sporosarcina globispora]KON87488.1 hypothetical protein AF332_12050 [Sporosarcina globispora]